VAKPPNTELVLRILKLAIDELATKTPEKINMRSLAERAGVSSMVIYYYFSSKEDLFERIKLDAISELEQLITSAEVKGLPARERLFALIRNYVDFCLENPHLVRLLKEDSSSQMRLTEESAQKYHRPLLLMQQLMEEAVNEGWLSTRDCELDASVVLAALWGIITQFQSKRVPPTYWGSIKPLVDRFIRIYAGDHQVGPE